MDRLFSDVKSENFENVAQDIRTFLDSPQSCRGAGCSPGLHHGGQYNGEKFSAVLVFLGGKKLYFSKHPKY